MTIHGSLRLIGLAAVLAAQPCSSSSCIAFDGQTVVTHVEPGKDRLDMLIVYRDLHSTGRDPAGAIEQLERLRAGERWFAFFTNWPTGLHIEALARQEEDEALPGHAARLVDGLERNVQVHPGSPWLDGEGRLCGRQFVRLRRLGEVVALANAALREYLADDDARRGFLEALHADDAESLALLEAALWREQDLLSLRGPAFALSVPMSERGYVQLKRAVLRGLIVWTCEEGLPPEGSHDRRVLDATIEVCASTPWDIERGDDHVTFVLGDPRSRRWVLEVPAVGGGRHGTLLPALREAGWTILGPEQQATVREEFEAFVREPAEP
jgi:hypothetical protein